MCLQPLTELPRNNKKSFLCLCYLSCVANAHCGMQPFGMRHGALDMAPGWCRPTRPLHHWLGVVLFHMRGLESISFHGKLESNAF